VAQSIEILIAVRFVQALGGAGCIVLARAAVRDLYSGVRAGRELSLMGSITAFAPIVAPAIGGVLQTAFGWRARFVLLVVFALPAIKAFKRRVDPRRYNGATLIGLKGIYCEDPEKIGAAWDEALASNRPVIMNMRADPNVPPLPPHITLKDAKHFMTMMEDEPELASVIKNSARQMLASILPGKAE